MLPLSVEDPIQPLASPPRAVRTLWGLTTLGESLFQAVGPVQAAFSSKFLPLSLPLAASTSPFILSHFLSFILSEQMLL